MRFWDWVEQEYLPKVLDYLEELKKRGFLVFACRGYAENDKEAKAPVNIPRGFDYAYGYKNPKLTEDTIERIKRKEALAFGIPGAPNKILWLDLESRLTVLLAALYELDIYTPVKEKEKLEELSEVMERLDPETSLDDAVSYLSEFIDIDKVYVEKTANAGLHIALKVETEQEYKLAASIHGAKPYLDNKLHGYVVAHPCVLAVKKEEKKVEVRPYVKLPECPELWDTASLNTYFKKLTQLILILKSVIDFEVLTVERSAEGKIEYTRVDDVADNVSKLSLEEALLYFYLVCKEVGCDRCVQYYVQKLIDNEPWDLPNLTYPTKIPRGLHYALELELLGAMYLVGFSEEQLYAVAERIRYKDYEPETPPEKTAEVVIRYGVRNVSIGFLGACPVLLANEISGRYVPKNCTSKLTVRINTLIKTRPYVLAHILRYKLPQVLKLCSV